MSTHETSELDAHRAAGASSVCPHSDLHIHVDHVHLADSNTAYLDITAKCNICGAPMAFQGCPLGVSPKQPTMALDGSVIHIPMRAAGEEPTGRQDGFALTRRVVE